MSLDANQNTVRLVCKQDPSYAVEVPISYMSISGFISSALSLDPTATEFEIDLSRPVLEQIVAYINHHKGVEPQLIEPPLRSRRMEDVCRDPWDAQFIEAITGRDQQLLYDVSMGALFFQIQSLLHLSCAKVASLIKGFPLDRVKSVLLRDANNRNGQFP